jgi:hypothetical protein
MPAEFDGNRPAGAAGPAGHQRHLALEIVHADERAGKP